jgi:hypothetical protein
MARLKPELQHREEPVEPAPIAEAGLAGGETIAVNTVLSAAVATDMEAARAKIKAMFGTVEPEPETVANGVPIDAIAPPIVPEPIDPEPVAGPVGEPAADPARKEIIRDLLAEGWRHSEAVWVADRALALIEEHHITAEYAKENAVYEFRQQQAVSGASRGGRIKEIVRDALDQETLAVPEANAVVTETEELTQVIHNLQRDIARLTRLLGLEGAKKTRKKKES